MSSSDSDEENVIKYGTPLEPYEEDEVPVKKKFQKDQSDQHALDTQGRRRFHGAFTGGFSAGYGNSVGTPEGWVPSAFKSSRSDKVKLSNVQRPEDFMDEEDRSEFGIAPKLIQTQNDFSGQKRPHQPRFYDGPIPGEPVLEQLIRPVHETAAVKMLRAMGWRPGQGTGERLNAGDKKKAKDKQKVYGCYLPMEMQQTSSSKDTEASSSSDSEFDYDTLFAPDDYEPYILRRKNDRFGLGYSGLSRHSVLGSLVGEYGQAGTSSSHLLMKDKGKKVSIRGQAFGVGALEDDDDEDIYAKEDMSHYDFTLGAEKQMDKKKSEQKSRNVLEGFVKASKPLPSVPFYPPPAIPRDYTPAPAGARRTRFEPTTEPERNQALGRHELSAEARGTLLGEQPLPEPKSPPKVTEDPIAKLVGRNVVFTNDTPDYIPINNSEPIGNLKVFKPFVGNYEKQRRYEKFLKDRDSSSVLESEATDRLSEWERNRELVEFEQAAKLYKPLTGAMGDRFTHASQEDDAVNPLCAVAKSSSRHGLATQEQMDAASKGLYGALTRTQTEWRPDSLVCKRFNVPDPFSSKPDPKKTEKPSVSYSIFNYLETSVHDKDSFTKEQSTFSGSKSLLHQPKPKADEVVEKKMAEEPMEDNAGPSKRQTVAELFMKEFEKDKEKPVVNENDSTTETINKFDKMALYKCIFLSDEEEEIESEVPNKNDYKESSYSDFMEMPKNVERNSSPPRGIFANIDFDELNSWKKFDDKNSSSINSENSKETNSVDLYGPKLPDTIVKVTDSVKELQPTFRSKSQREIIDLETSSSSESWVELTEAKVKKQKKKKHKHKSKNKKSKHKKKKER